MILEEREMEKERRSWAGDTWGKRDRKEKKELGKRYLRKERWRMKKEGAGQEILGEREMENEKRRSWAEDTWGKRDGEGKKELGRISLGKGR